MEQMRLTGVIASVGLRSASQKHFDLEPDC